MWKKPKKKKVLAPITQQLKDLREEDERLTKKVGRMTKKGHHKSQS